MNTLRFGKRRVIRRSLAACAFRPFVEDCERRVLLASNFLQGFATLGSAPTQTPLPGAIVTLETLPGATPVATQTTGADGSYLFTGLAAGMYRLVETPPGTDTNAGTSVFTQLDQVTATTSSSIDVTIGDPGTTPPWTVDTVSSNKDSFSFTASSPHVNQSSHNSAVGSLNITVDETDLGFTTPQFSTFCVDLNRDIFPPPFGNDMNLPYNGEPLDQALATAAGTSEANAGRIAWLYNNFGQTTTGNDQASAGLQLAIWELEYETALTGSNIAVPSATGISFASSTNGGPTDATVTVANEYLSASVGQTGKAVYLNGLPEGAGSEYPNGSQSLIAQGEFDFNNSAGTTTFGVPSLAVTKTADQPSIIAGQTAGFTVTITNTGLVTDNGVTLSDALPPGTGGDVNWTIDTTVGNPTDFSVTGAAGSQNLGLSTSFVSAGDSLAPGQSISVHITSPTNTNDAISSTNAALNVGGIGNYTVLYEGTGTNQLSITNDTINGNIGVGGGQVQFNGPGTIGGRLDFSGANTGQYHNTNKSNVGPASVNYNVSAVTSAITAVNSLSTALGGLAGTNISFNNANQTVNESAGTLETSNGVSYRVFNVTSYSENNASTVTINGDGSGDPVVFNFANNSNTNLGGQVALTGGLTADQVMWNFTSSNKQVQLTNNGGTFAGVLLLPNDQYQSNNSNLNGRVYGGAAGNMQIVSGANVSMPLTVGTLPNTATVSGTSIPPQSASATIKLTPVPATGPLGADDAATIGFWHNKNGQAVINSFNGSSTSTAFGNWVAALMPNTFGAKAGAANNLTGQTNAQVAAYYLTLFSASGLQKTYAQVLSVALAVYANTSGLGYDSTAAGFGFNGVGTGGKTFNVGTAGLGIKVSNGSILTIEQILIDLDNLTVGGVTPDLSDVNTIFNGINSGGDIS